MSNVVDSKDNEGNDCVMISPHLIEEYDELMVIV